MGNVLRSARMWRWGSAVAVMAMLSWAAPIRAEGPDLHGAGRPTAPRLLADTRDPRAADERPQLLAPTQGRPVFGQAGQPLTCLLRLPEGAEPPRLFLCSSLFPELRYPLLPSGPLKSYGDGYAQAEMAVAASTPAGLYDLVMSVASTDVVNRHSVSIVTSYRTNFRFVHLSNMNIGDPTAMEFDARIPEEVNLLAPEFIVATGDYTEWARLCDQPGDWQRVLDYMARFEVPVFLVCGDHDHEPSFTRFVANSPVGTIDYGKVHGLLLLDHGNHPIEQDDDQIRWVLQDLEAGRDNLVNFVVCHSDELGLIRRLREMKLAEKVVRDYRLKMVLCGGQSDWDYREFAILLNGLPGLHYVRTGQSSTAVRDRAGGESRYRVIEVNNDRISYIYPAESLDTRAQYSVPAGRIHVTRDAPNDGSCDPVGVHVANVQNRGWNDCRLWLRVRKDAAAGARPAVVGGVLLRCLDAGSYWACQVSFDLPDKGAVSVQAGSASRLIPGLPVQMEIISPEQLTFVPRAAPYGLTYFACTTPALLRLTNASDKPMQVWPIVRLNGSNLPLTGSGPHPLPLTLEPTVTQTLRVGLTLGQLALGPHTLQAYLLNDPLRRLTTQQVVVLLGSDSPQVPQPASQPAGAAASQVVSSRPVPASQAAR